MSILNPEVQKQVSDLLAGLPAPVQLAVFVQPGEEACEMCAATRELVEEVAALSPQLAVEVHDVTTEAGLAQAYGIDKTPAIAVLRGGPLPKDYGIRFYGIPAGYEFTSLIQVIQMVGAEQVTLSAQTQKELARLDRPVHLQVFVTPTCPYCPRAVLLAYQLAIASDHVRADMVEANEFPELSERYEVYGVPRTVINETIHIEGAVPEQALMPKLMSVLNGAGQSQPDGLRIG